jgi:hypothetical protein
VVRFLAGSEVFLTPKRPDQLCCQPTYPRHTLSVPDALSLDAERPKREADHSPSTSAEAMNECGHTSTQLYHVCFNGVHRDSFTFIYYLREKN